MMLHRHFERVAEEEKRAQDVQEPVEEVKAEKPEKNEPEPESKPRRGRKKKEA